MRILEFTKIAFQKEFRKPILAGVLSITALVFNIPFLYVLATILGLAVLVFETVLKIRERKFSLDYIAILAMVTALITREYAAGAIISIMILLSEALELFGSNQAEEALSKLVERIPKICDVKTTQGIVTKNIQDVREGEIILIKPQEVIPLDGYLISTHALIDESSLTGEPIPQNYSTNQFLKSGFLNAGNLLELKVEGDFSRSTYQKIIGLVKEAKKHPAGIVRLAEKYNYAFTAITLIIAAFAYLISHETTRVLAVLVIATPCPLLIAAPVSFLGGMNKASKSNIIIKRPAILEILSRIKYIFFDKTGTLTLGEPKLVRIEIRNSEITEDILLTHVAAIERHSLHPLARAIISAKNERKLPDVIAENVNEIVGQGISGNIKDKTYTIKKSAVSNNQGISIDILTNNQVIAELTFSDTLKSNTIEVLSKLKDKYKIAIVTGDTEANTKRLFDFAGITIHAHTSPEEKYKIIKSAQTSQNQVLMVGDGLNDAPALALANVGMVFSGTENSASIDAAGVAILNHDISSVERCLDISNRTVLIAKQSIIVGIGLSIAGMLFAMFGFIPPIYGALLQELIDVLVILNALRAAR